MGPVGQISWNLGLEILANCPEIPTSQTRQVVLRPRDQAAARHVCLELLKQELPRLGSIRNNSNRIFVRG